MKLFLHLLNRGGADPILTFRPSSGGKLSAFTLIELLVVIAIIAILAALLLSSSELIRDAVECVPATSSTKDSRMRPVISRPSFLACAAGRRR